MARTSTAPSALRLLGNSLPPGCTVYSSDVRVRIEATGLVTFPDASVVCGPARSSDIDRHALTNPAILVEVTSRSTEDYDRGEKLRNHQALPSLAAALLISHRAREVTVVRREGAAWVADRLGPGEVLRLAEPGCSLAIDELYRGVELE